MSVLDSFFSKTGFKAAKCKTLLKLAIPRIKLLRNRREIQIKQMRRDIANLLQNGQEATARIRVEHIIREENMMAAQEIIELFCELIVVRLPIIETQRECPLDLKEAISSICFAAPRCSDLPELQQVQMHFAAKYGREFVAAATELRPDCGVNRQVIELLSVRAPSVESKLKLLKEIAEEHEVDWDPAESEKELLKPHEDLLNGPNHLLGGSTGSPEGKDKDSLSSKHVVEQEFSSDEDVDYLDLPEVPKATVQPSPSPPVDHEIFPSPDSHPTVQPTAPHIFSHAQSPPHDSSDPNYENSKSISSHENPHQAPDLESKSDKQQEPSVNASLPATAKEKSLSVPFVSSPSSPPSVSLKQDEQASLKGSNQSKQITESSSVSKNDSSADLQDVIAAARAAADTAERAAAAARAAASLAQVRITELVSRRNSQTPEVIENELNGGPQPQNSKETHKLEKQISSGRLSGIPDNLPRTASGSLIFSSHDQSPEGDEGVTEHHLSHQPQRSTSLDDDPYFSYPNLFTPQNSFRRS